MKPRLTLTVFTPLLALAAIACASEPPSVLLILADDLGYADISCYGSRRVETPNIDRLAREGVRFTQFYANAPECTPSRTALLTGRYPQRPGGLECAIGVGNAGRYDDAMRLAQQHELGLPADMTVLPSALEPRGYHDAIIGKWHLGSAPKFNPLEHGFDFFIGLIGANADYFHHTESSDDPTRPGDHVLYRNREEYFDDRYLTHLITDEAVDWLERVPAGEPFFLYAAHFAPHNPQQGPNDRRETPLIGPAFNRNDPEIYREVIMELDKGVGALLEKLEELGRANNTIVIFTSDNGPTRVGETQPFRGTKGTLLEGGIRVPCIIRWPGRIEPGTTTDQVAITMDLTHSIVRHTGADVSALPLDGIDILGRVLADEPPEPRTLFWRYRRGLVTRKAVRDGDLKLIEDREAEAHAVHLYDVATDPGETRDLVAERPSELKRLRALLADWEKRVHPVR